MSGEGKVWLEVCPECFYAQGATLMEEPPLCPEVLRKHPGIPPRMVRVIPASERVTHLSDAELHQLEEEVIAEIGRRG